MTDKKVLKVKNLVKTYKRRKTREKFVAVDEVSFEIKQGEIFALLGPNGAGKTTTIKSICGLLLPDSGSIEIMGKNLLKRRREALKHISAVLEGNRNLYWRMTPVENMIYFSGIRGKKLTREEALKILKKFNLEEKANDLVQQLSRGMQQKSAVAVCLATGADILLLDEPTLGLDVASSIELRSILRNITEKEGKTILLSTHDMNLVEAIADRVAIMSKGKIVVCEEKEKLMDMFRARRYVLKVSNKGKELEPHLKEFGAVDIKKEDGLFEFKIDLENPQKLFDLMDALKTMGTEIKSIEQDTVNFEKIFMKYVEQS
ncbi:ABC transporter ATP-binding protein [Kosmotoga olearia]|uniref:ABC transporter related n=1 Tax=Kosmotoga olearia (strain ATCC BAA-1733 / DSM 21960 / TBF 19.5.1) TaxID=521045 RepID=C5CII8_KOSOT|nr:ABC transporter ATP-binding protein [Kosmotoga olearia]ACR79851.1 ABC transporter related [Kosmotoga olearia TBF 19.5.1]